jgi:hypothetical protein
VSISGARALADQAGDPVMWGPSSWTAMYAQSPPGMVRRAKRTIADARPRAYRPMTITCFIRYRIDPFQRDAFAHTRAAGSRSSRAAAATSRLFLRTRARTTSPGASSRSRASRVRGLPRAPEGDAAAPRRNFAFARDKRFILSEERTFLEERRQKKTQKKVPG